MAPPEEATGSRRSFAPTLSMLGISKRRLGFRLGGAVLLVTLALLVIALPPGGSDDAGSGSILSGLLSPGPLERGHVSIADRCVSCHRQAFEKVADATCSECHARMKPHLPAAFDQHALLARAGCADCHPAHTGKADAVKGGSEECVDCHRKTEKTAGEVLDFFTSHPDFRLTLRLDDQAIRFRPHDPLAPPDQPGIKFSHGIHLDEKGIASPDGDTRLVCGDCHRLEESGVHFAPIEMEKTCQQSRCHRQRFEPPLRGFAPHGSERLAMNLLREHYLDALSGKAGGSTENCRRESSASRDPLRRAINCADRLARDYAATKLFRKTGDNLKCALCHEIDDAEGKRTPWRVRPVRINRDWQPMAVFPHAKHATAECTDCHDKKRSKASEDRSFPDLEKCRECHAGQHAMPGRITSTCASCHRFHRNPATP